MRLLLDAGNSLIKWQLRQDGGILKAGVSRAESVELFGELDSTDWARIRAVSVCTVRSEPARKALEQLIAAHTSAGITYYWTESCFGQLVCAYQEPATMGADRWCAMVGAWARIAGACVVIDAGSAITVDWVDATGRHQGGYILPGRNLMLDALSEKTARVFFQKERELHQYSPGRSTSECVLHGVNWLLRTLALELGADARTVMMITGGDGSYIKKALEESVAPGLQVMLCPDLVLDGLAVLADR